MLALGAAACGGGSDERGQATTANGGSGGSGGAGLAGGSAGSSAELDACQGRAPALDAAAAGRIELPIRLTLNELPAVIGEPGTGKNGREFTLSLFKFFVAEPVLIDASGGETATQILSAAASPSPYGLHLVDADDAATQVLRLAAKPGRYTALRLGVGVPKACNVASTNSVFPLNPDSDMFWTWGSQFMFVRIEGSTRASPTDEWGAFMYHVGYDAAFATITIPGVLNVGITSTGPHLSLHLDRMLESDGSALPSAKHNVPDGWVVDNLENNQAFSLQ